eukprot:TRINITY_DN3818_c0_g1_i1.p1 TRINITY_DN3818_c0_g1~~TRINITY_DN3818_c0_g1_i1.p1  ORF type:complete len:482 (-),score=99.09 TRINITY_DN3818_c0_g1_i1:183-1628(-)
MTEIRQHKRVEEFMRSRQILKPDDPNTDGKITSVDNPEMAHLREFVNENLKKTFSNEDFSWLAENIKSEDIFKQHLGVIGLRKILARKTNTPIQDVIDINLVPRLLYFMERDDQPHLQLEAAWALTNVCSGSTFQTKSIIDKGGIKSFVRLLKNRPLNISEQAIWALGNISAEGSSQRDVILEEGALDSVVEILLANIDNKKLWSHGRWALSNMCRGRPAPRFEYVFKSFPIFIDALQTEENPEVLGDCIWALTYFSEAKERIPFIIEAGTIPKLVNHLRKPQLSILIPALRVIGNILLGSQEQCEYVLENGILPYYDELIKHPNKAIQREICWSISNLVTSQKVIEELIQFPDIIKTLMKILESEAIDLRQEVLWTFRNIFKNGSINAIDQVVNGDFFEIIKSILQEGHHDHKCIALEAIYYLLETTRRFGRIGTVYDVLESVGIVKVLEDLQGNPSMNIYAKAVTIIENFYNTEEESIF